MKFFKLFLPLMILMGLGAEVSIAAFKRPTNHVLKIGMTQEFENMNPLIKQMMATTYIYEMVGRGLTVLNAKGKRIPQLAVSIPTFKNKGAERFTEKGVKKLKANWEIKQEANWGDGIPVTGYDIRFSWKVARSPKVSVGSSEIYNNIEKIIINKKNPKKFTLIFKKAKWDFNQMEAFAIVPRHLEESIFKKYGNLPEGYSKNSLYSKKPSHPGLYNGPYVIDDIKLGSHVSLRRNPHFYGNQAKIRKIILKLIPNTGTLEANLRAGNIDMISILGMSLDQAIAFEKKASRSKLPFQVNFKPGLIYEHIDLQLGNPILKDVNVRKALVHSINRKKLTDALFSGKQKPAIHNIAPIDPWYTGDPDKIVLYKHSRRMAKKLLDAAGWITKEDGFRYKEGKKLSFQFMTTSGNKLRELVQVFLKNEWSKVGVEVLIKNEPPRVYFGETVKKSKYPAMAMFAWISAPESTPRSMFHSSEIPSKKNGFKGQNSPRWVNKDVDSLLDKIDVTFEADERAKLVEKVLYHYTNEVPVIPLYYRSDISITPRNLKGYNLTGHQYSAANHVELWNLL